MRGQTLILRADASEAIGTGHVMRAMAFGQHWSENGGRVVFAASVLPSSLQLRLQEEGFDCRRISAAAGTQADARETVELAIAAGARWIGVDGHNLSPSYQQEVRARAHRLLLIDDYPKAGRYCANIVVNTDLSSQQENLYADREGHTRLLLGPEYALLRREFLEVPPEMTPRARSVPHILITFGGSDPENMTEAVLRGLAAIEERRFEARVVVGTSNPRLAELQRFAGSHGQGSIELLTNVRHMPVLMRWADLAIVAAGITVWEFLYLGVPCLCWPRHDFDQRNLSWFERKGVLALLPRNGESAATVKLIFELVDDPSRALSMSKLSRALVDGRGSARILAAIRHLDAHLAARV